MAILISKANSRSIHLTVNPSGVLGKPLLIPNDQILLMIEALTQWQERIEAGLRTKEYLLKDNGSATVRGYF